MKRLLLLTICAALLALFGILFTYQPGFNNKKAPQISVRQKTGGRTSEKSYAIDTSSHLSKQRKTTGLFVIQDKKPQYFTVNNKRDTVLTCKEGTKVTIPANAFVNKNRKTPGIQVSVSIKEYYSNADILLAGLTTGSGKEMLETGGMICINAHDGNEVCELKEDKKISVFFPSTAEKKDMQLFNGKLTEGIMDWIPAEKPKEIPPPPLVETDDKIYDTYEVSEQAEFPGGMDELKKFLAKNIKYPDMERESGIQGRVFIEFVVGSDGSIDKVQIKRGVSPGLDRESMRVVQLMPKWKPGKINGTAVSQRYIIPIVFRLSDGAPPVKHYQEKVTERTVSEAKVQDIQGYVLSSAQLGWINCDRFVQATKKIDFVVDDTEKENTMMALVFHRIRSVMPACYDGHVFRFANVPAGEPVTLLAIQRKQGKNFIAVYESNTSSKKISLNYTEVSMETLKKRVEQLNALGKPSPPAISMNQ